MESFTFCQQKAHETFLTVDLGVTGLHSSVRLATTMSLLSLAQKQVNKDEEEGNKQLI